MNQMCAAPSSKWPRHEDICWVPIHRVLHLIETPSTTTSGRMYTITGREKLKIEKIFKKLQI